MMTRAQVEARAAQNREEWLRHRAKCAIKSGMTTCPPLSWATELCPEATEALWEAIWKAEMTKVPPSFENGSEK